MTYHVLVLVHLLGATIWLGGHAALVAAVLPGALHKRDAGTVVEFEQGFGRIALAALAIQTITGFWLAHLRLGTWANIFQFANPAAHLVLIKLGLLVMTLTLAGHAYHRLLPRLNADRLGRFALHAWRITALAVLMLVAGASLRLGGHL